MTDVDYAALSLTDVGAELGSIAREVQATFGGLIDHQLNWRPGLNRWSVAQCFVHLLMTNELMFRASEDALKGTAPASLWRRLPFLPRIFGPMLIRSQSPTSARKFVASPNAQPATSDIPADVVHRFVDQQRHAVSLVERLDEPSAARAIMTSPFAKVVTYSVLDGWRLVVAHDRRHMEQARRVMSLPEFPGS
jgi:hypothetical protein